MNEIEIEWSEIFVKDSILATMMHHKENEILFCHHTHRGYIYRRKFDYELKFHYERANSNFIGFNKSSWSLMDLVGFNRSSWTLMDLV